MKLLVTSLIFILPMSLTWGQANNDTVFIKYNKDRFGEIPNYKTDTIIFDTPNARQILYGTTVLPWTQNQQIAKGYGLYLDSVSITPCREDFEKILDMKNQVIAVNRLKDNLIIQINYWGNCCHSFLCDLKVKNDTILNLIIHGYGATYCSCDCCFGLTYYLTTMKGDEFNKLKHITIKTNDTTYG